MQEVCFLIADDGAILWSDASGDPVRLPDSRERWEKIWSQRDRLVEIAHSHPCGLLAFSTEDETTMSALNLALGRALTYSVITPDHVLRRGAEDKDEILEEEPWWADLMRLASGMKENSHGKSQHHL